MGLAVFTLAVISHYLGYLGLVAPGFAQLDNLIVFCGFVTWSISSLPLISSHAHGKIK